MINARIYKPMKNAMQSGQGRTKHWVLEFIEPANIYVEPLMKWVGSYHGSILPCLYFGSCDDAIKYAISRKIPFVVEPEHSLKVKPKRYSDNFTRLNKY